MAVINGLPGKSIFKEEKFIFRVIVKYFKAGNRYILNVVCGGDLTYRTSK